MLKLAVVLFLLRKLIHKIDLGIDLYFFKL